MVEIFNPIFDRPICQDCLKEYFDSSNLRRYFYPFIACNNCGSFFSTLFFSNKKFFNICDECKKEYEEKSSRRYLYPFICCSKCGSKMQTVNIEFQDYKDLFEKVAYIIDKGEIVILKTTNIFYFITDATNLDSISKLRQIKKTFKPLAVIFKDFEMLKNFVDLDEEIDNLENSFDIKIIRCKNTKIVNNVDYLAVSFANDPFFVGIFYFLKKPIVYTSVNISGQAPYSTNEEVIETFSSQIKYFVLNDFNIKILQDFSIVYNAWDVCIRRGIGRVGKLIESDYNLKDCICLGPELESSVTFSKNNKIFVSSRLGHLVNQHVFDNYKKLINDILNIFDINPEVMVCDLHPYYLSTSLAVEISQNLNIPLKYVQHHKAHIYSLIIDRKIKDQIIGFSFDGTGYGEDGKIWGGEIFVGNFYNLKRVAHFSYIPVIGGDSSIENPVFIALSFVAKYLPHKVDLFKQVNKLQKEIVLKQIETNTNVYWTSSVGRLFDIAAVLLKIKEDKKINFSGQAAIELENIASRSHSSLIMPFEILENQEIINIDFTKVFEYIINRRDCENYSDLARGFHNTIIESIYQVSKILKGKYGLENVGFSGGVFQNKILLHLIQKKFQDFKIYFHRNISPNDSGISVGQLQAALKDKH